ncbi:4-hydroxy-3-methylbut-2-en-1-yl diphosphate synthase IspG/GcpE [Streptomyces sp. B1I3]|nr:4-hydroxy-3-methylbut-2-en-1-yl diphosphate synthase IspG/GcpE [Streptomyces sp. B1I3]
MEVPPRVASAGCAVVGPGEADPGVAPGNGKGQIFVKGETVRTGPEPKIVEALVEEAMKSADGTKEAGAPSGARP